MYFKEKRKHHITPEKKAELRAKALEILNSRSFADPTYDVSFKMLFEDKKLLQYFINTLLN